MSSPTINKERLWQAHMDMAHIGPTPEGGSRRLALSAEDGQARALLQYWCRPLGLKVEIDAIGNMFLRRPGTEDVPAVAFGSHLDTVPTGGRFDGVSGVLVGLEVMRALDEAGIRTRRPLELVNWTNEEGSRFPPAMMGSRVHGGNLPLATALATRDDALVSVAEALQAMGITSTTPPGPRDWAAWLELHIEQGPMLEATNTDIGIVTGTMHARYFQLLISGEPSHSGATPMDRRKDSLAAAAEIILADERIGRAAEPAGRGSASWIENLPNARGNVPDITRLHCDVRHTDQRQAEAMEAELRAAIKEIADRRGVWVQIDPYATFGPVHFDTNICELLRRKAQERQYSARNATAAAGHDSVFVAHLCPSAMLFIPCAGGITHNPKESTTPEQVARGAQVLLDTVLELAG
jgi:N-carbamoyl-L-amino-acid hydrolase